MSDGLSVSCPVPHRPRHRNCVFATVSVGCWTTDSWQWCLNLNVVSSISAWTTALFLFLYRLYPFPCASTSKLNRKMCVSPEPGQNWHMCSNKYLFIRDGLSVVQCRAIKRTVFWHSVCVVERSCWTTDIWRCCLSSNVHFNPRLVQYVYVHVCVYVCMCAYIKNTRIFVICWRK